MSKIKLRDILNNYEELRADQEKWRAKVRLRKKKMVVEISGPCEPCDCENCRTGISNWRIAVVVAEQSMHLSLCWDCVCALNEHFHRLGDELADIAYG
jgi:hypothetical protein